jgi:chlorophyll(ide) b reductase
LADPPEVVAKLLVPQIRKVALDMELPGSGKPQYIRYLTKLKAYSQIFQRLLFGQRKNRFLEEG